MSDSRKLTVLANAVRELSEILSDHLEQYRSQTALLTRMLELHLQDPSLMSDDEPDTRHGRSK